MFRPIPMYETNDIQLHFLVQLFWYLSQWSGLICIIFYNRLYNKDIHCVWHEIGLYLCLLIQKVTINYAAIDCAMYIDFSYRVTFSQWDI